MADKDKTYTGDAEYSRVSKFNRLVEKTKGLLKTTEEIQNSKIDNLVSYTVATLPAGTEGDLAYVTDANLTGLAWREPVSGGGTDVVLVFHTGLGWVYH